MIPLRAFLVFALLFAVPIVAFIFFNQLKIPPSETESKPRENTVTTYQPTLKEGVDWSLPAYAQASREAGMIDEASDNGSPYALYLVRWDKANPRANHYNFSALDHFLEQNPETKLLIRLEVNSACEAPPWVLKTLKSSKKKSLIFWDGRYRKILKPFVKAFAQRFAAHPQIIGVQLGIGDGKYNGSCRSFEHKDGWGEFWMTEKERIEAERKFKFTPKRFKKETLALIDDYVEAFGQYKDKLAFTNFEPFYTSGKHAKRYNRLMSTLAVYALKKGVGNRDGAIEEWMRYTQRIYGMRFSPAKNNTCQLEMSESFAALIKGRYWGSENEFYGNEAYVLEANGAYTNQPYRFFVSSLRALQMRRNYFTINATAMQSLVKANPKSAYNTADFLEYLTKTLGKQPENTPDAFILLGERYIDQGRTREFKNLSSCTKDNAIAVRSFGRWLTESSDSQAALRVEMPFKENRWGQDFYLPETVDYEFSARSGKQFEFKLNPRLTQARCAKTCQVEVKITFKDRVKTQLQLGIGNQKTAILMTNGDQKIKTASFSLNLDTKRNAEAVDFFLTSEDKIPVMLVRVNFLDQPTDSVGR
ncbi:MAG: hypothetical protein KAG28_10725 [Cocleimonas sp.]|nr:hypothetical protein [Cocleimonas sp.]